MSAMNQHKSMAMGKKIAKSGAAAGPRTNFAKGGQVKNKPFAKGGAVSGKKSCNY